MASSGTFTSRRYGNSSVGPYLTLAWTQVSQSVANNTTTLDLTLRFHWSGSIYYVFHNRSGSLQGNSYTYSGSASGTSGNLVLRTQRVTISHNSNGAKSVTLSGNITGLGLNYSGNRVNTMSVSGTANLNTIPRAGTLSAFSFNAHLKNGVANQINYTIDRKSSDFRHHIQLRDGNTVLRTWDNVDSDGKSTLPLTASEVNTLLNRMSSSTTKSYTLRVRTRSGVNGGWIGSAVSRNATATVHADVKPTVSAVTLSQTGNPVSSHTLQGFSKIKASFTRSAGYGASISSSSIQVRRKSGGADSQTINSNDGTTSNSVALNGVYEARGTARDSRGRTTNTAWATITVTPYSAPTITNFSAVRNGSTPERVDISRTTTHTVLGTSNHLTYTIQRRQGTGAWTNVNTGATGTVTTSGATGSATSTGNSVTQSYEFRLVVQDKLGGKAESLQSISTQRVVLDVHKNEGVGIGKIHERGVLDVDGSAYFHGDVEFLGGLISTMPAVSADTPYDEYPSGISMFSSASNAHNGFPDGYHTTVNFNASSYRNGQLVFGHPRYGKLFYRGHRGDTGWADFTEVAGFEYGTNSNGDWVRFSDGTQICFGRHTTTESVSKSSNGAFLSNIRTVSFPVSFFGTPRIVATAERYTGDRILHATIVAPRSANFDYVMGSPVSFGAYTNNLFWSAMGRWKE